MADKKVPTCLCQRLTPIPCDNPMTQEDLLCDDCRAGCNAAFGARGRGFHWRGEITIG